MRRADEYFQKVRTTFEPDGKRFRWLIGDTVEKVINEDALDWGMRKENSAYGRPTLGHTRIGTYLYLFAFLAPRVFCEGVVEVVK